MRQTLQQVIRACSDHAIDLEQIDERHCYLHAINLLLEQAAEIDRLTALNARLKAELKKDRPA